jgi:hypothetical protein
MNSKTTKNELAEGSFIACPPRQNFPTACNVSDGHCILQTRVYWYTLASITQTYCEYI